MRASMAEDSQFAMRCRAWLDGVEVSIDCFEADEEQGYVLIYKKSETGRYIPDPITRCPLWERKEGVVRIEGPEEEVKLAEWDGWYPAYGLPDSQRVRHVVYARHPEEAEDGPHS